MSKIALPLAGRPGEGGGTPRGGPAGPAGGVRGGVGGAPPPGVPDLGVKPAYRFTGPATSTMALVTLV